MDYIAHNCPNCGAVVNDFKCPYCGTILYDFANLKIGQESYIRMKIANNLLVFRAFVTSMYIENRTVSDLYANNKLIACVSSPDVLHLTMEVVQDNDGALWKKFERREDETD